MKDLLRIVYDEMDKKQADDLVVIDFRNYSPFIDYFVIGTARNARMAKAILDSVEDVVIKEGFDVLHKNVDGSKWQLLDLGEVVCHVFYDDERSVYNLEGLWKDLPTVEM